MPSKNMKDKCQLKHYLDYVFRPTSGEWFEAYANYLMNGKKIEGSLIDWEGKARDKTSCDPYDDIDRTCENHVRVKEYYHDLTTFLNNQNESVMKGERFFREPTGVPEGLYRYGYDDVVISIPKDRSIYITEGSDILLNRLFLTSDTFGFSAPEKNQNDKHPYLLYLKNNKTEETTKAVATWIYNTRTIGGAFIWPKVYSSGKWQSIYNRNRGVGSYINDRIDLTLYEIKKFYDYFLEYKNEEDTITAMNKAGYILLRGADNKLISRWLRYFNNFNTYIKFFCFQNFVTNEQNCKTGGNEWFPINICQESGYIEYQDDFQEKYKKEYKDILSEQDNLAKMLYKVMRMSIKRSEEMIYVINNT